MATLYSFGNQFYNTQEEVVSAVEDRQAKLTALGDVLVAGTHLERTRGRGKDKDRLEVQFDVETATIYPAGKKLRKDSVPLKGAILLRYVEQPSKTPTGGRFIARRLLVLTVDKSGKSRRWVGQMKNGSNVVRLRPEPKNATS